MALLDALEGLVDKYFFEPVFQEGIADLYSGSVLEKAYQSTIDPILSYELYSKGDPTGNVGAESVKTIGGVLKDFGGGFLNIGQGKGGSGLYSSGPIKMPPAPKVNAPRSKAGRSQFTSTKVNLAGDFGFTNNVKGSLYKASTSDVPAIKDLVNSIMRNVNRRSGTKTKLGTAALGRVGTKTSMPYSRKPKYFE